MTRSISPSQPKERPARKRGFLLTLLALFAMMILSALLGIASARRYPGPPPTPSPTADSAEVWYGRGHALTGGSI